MEQSIVSERLPLWQEAQKVQTDLQVCEFEKLVWPYRLMVPFLFIVGAYVQLKKAVFRLVWGRACVPYTNFWLVDGASLNSRKVKDGAARWQALDAVYNFRTGEGGTVVTRIIDGYWLHIRNAQAARNRLKIVKRELQAAIRRIAVLKVDYGPVRVLSLAAGSGQGVIEAVADLQRVGGIRCEVLLIDKDESALIHARNLARLHEVNVIARKGDVVFFNRELQGFEPDIIEMCGLMDYLRDTTAIALIRKIRRYLRPDGFFLTCHIHPNAESYFLRHVVDWDMLYRTRPQLADVLVEGGFLGVRLHTEPHQIHSVAVAQKI